MLTMFKQIFTWWNHQTLGTRIYTFIFGKFKEKIILEINITKVNQERDGLFITAKLIQVKYPTNGFLGYIL